MTPSSLMRPPILLQITGHSAYASLRNCLTNAWYLKLPLASTGTSASISSTCAAARITRQSKGRPRIDAQNALALRSLLQSDEGGQTDLIAGQFVAHAAQSRGKLLTVAAPIVLAHDSKAPMRLRTGRLVDYARVRRRGSSSPACISCGTGRQEDSNHAQLSVHLCRTP